MIEQLIQLAKNLRAASARGEAPGLNDDEVSFYDARAANESAVQVLGEPQLAIIARGSGWRNGEAETIDWTLKQSVRAQLRLLVKRSCGSEVWLFASGGAGDGCGDRAGGGAIGAVDEARMAFCRGVHQVRQSVAAQERGREWRLMKKPRWHVMRRSRTRDTATRAR